jgi:hypothetical protein
MKLRGIIPTVPFLGILKSDLLCSAAHTNTQPHICPTVFTKELKKQQFFVLFYVCNSYSWVLDGGDGGEPGGSAAGEAARGEGHRVRMSRLYLPRHQELHAPGIERIKNYTVDELTL